MNKPVKVKGFVAVDNCGDKTIYNPTGRRVAFFPQKPVRDLLTDNHYWAAHISPYDVIYLGYEDFSELKWEDEPIEVEITVKVMKQNKIQQYLCDVIHSQADFWKHSNDITSPTHLCDVEEECYAQLCDLISDEDREEFEEKLKDLYWFIRKFD